ncbi:hypothetical protein POL68_27535 [Stigmatella sp. ncwal1]|uniref:Uncharacterized protein n=1 Tax=Stigmatella ashevillensis TaxID=2995309 RepID=A0ABT5DFH2_9BACT|nr:hypothetical protein [Stigmatella ashevillena]MDC0712251.1 hypothetical protein [Stigmatella ashevillena]
MKATLLLLLLVPALSRAGQVCVASSDNRQQLTFIQSHLNEEARRVRLWTDAWGAGYGALTLGQLAAASALPKKEQVDFYVGAVSSAGGLAALLAMPLDVMADALALDALVLAHPGEIDCEVLAKAERLLVRSAQSEAMGRSWMMHGASALYSLLTGLVLGLGFDRWSSGAFTAVTGLLVGEVMLLTQPSGAEDTLRRYRAGALSASRGPPVPTWHLQAAVAPSRAGLQLSMSF